MTSTVSQKLMLALSIFLTVFQILPHGTAMGQYYRPRCPQQEAALLRWMTRDLLVRCPSRNSKKHVAGEGFEPSTFGL